VPKIIDREQYLLKLFGNILGVHLLNTGVHLEITNVIQSAKIQYKDNECYTMNNEYYQIPLKNTKQHAVVNNINSHKGNSSSNEAHFRQLQV